MFQNKQVASIYCKWTNEWKEGMNILCKGSNTRPRPRTQGSTLLLSPHVILGPSTQISTIQNLEKRVQYKTLWLLHTGACTCTGVHTHTHNSIYGRERTGIQWDFESIFITYYVPGPVLSAGLHQWPTQMFFNCVVRDKTNKLDNFRYCNIQQNRIG